MKLTTWKRFHLLIFNLVLILAAAALFFYWSFYSYWIQKDAGSDEQKYHFVLMIEPDSLNDMETEIENVKKEWNLGLEIHTFETVSEQKSMLRILPDTDVDGVLLWPISENNEDYADELQALREKGLPVIVIERNVAPQDRDSYIGSGFSSDSVVLKQCLLGQNSEERFLVGNRFGSGSNQVFEFLIFSKNDMNVDLSKVRNLKLCRMAEDPPEGYEVEQYICLTGEEARSLNVRETLEQLIGETHPCLIFSLDNTLTSLVMSAENEAAKSGAERCYILGYGEREIFDQALIDGSLNGLVVSRPEVSVSIGLRYLQDLRRNMWVPSQMDSGINFIRREDLLQEK